LGVDHGLPLGLEQPVEALSDLVVSEIFPALQGRFAKLNGFNKAGLLGEIPADGLLGESVRVAASLCGKFCQLVLLLRSEMYFLMRQFRDCRSATPTRATFV
jgi:hypothetical protein